VDFTESNSPELDTLLQKYRDELFVPQTLAEHHRRLMYRPTRHSTLTSEEGVTVSISDEEDVQLIPRKLSDRPVKQKSLAQIQTILSQSPSRENWLNLFPFLEGMKTSKEPVPLHFLKGITRKANLLGVHSFMLECANQPKRTGYYVQIPGIAQELLLGCHIRLIESGLQGTEAQKAIKQSKHIIDLMSKREQESVILKNKFDMRRSLFTNAMALEIAAAEVLYHESETTVDTVAKRVSVVMALSEKHVSNKTEAAFEMPEFSTDIKNYTGSSEYKKKEMELAKLGDIYSQIELLVPLLGAMKLAQKVPQAIPGGDRPAFSHRMSQLEAHIKELSQLPKQSKSYHEGMGGRAKAMLDGLRKALSSLEAANP
jgi:hypothetical protein